MQAPRLPDPLSNRFARTVWSMAHTRSAGQILRDLIEIFAITLRQAAARLTGPGIADLEARYLKLVGSFPPTFVRDELPQLLAELQIGLADRPRDVLGPVYMEFAASNWAGQFFTPDAISEVLAEMTLPSSAEILAHVSTTRRLFRISDPAVGAGSMPLAAHRVLAKRGVHPSLVLYDVVDIDERCVHMAYVQLALAGCSARVHHGDSLAMSISESWPTPALEAFRLATATPPAAAAVQQAAE